MLLDYAKLDTHTYPVGIFKTSDQLSPDIYIGTNNTHKRRISMS